jgi:hypothetical protein
MLRIYSWWWILVLSDFSQQFSLKGEGYGNHMIQKAWVHSPQVCLAPNTYHILDAVPRGEFFKPCLAICLPGDGGREAVKST